MAAIGDRMQIVTDADDDAMQTAIDLLTDIKALLVEIRDDQRAVTEEISGIKGVRRGSLLSVL